MAKPYSKFRNAQNKLLLKQMFFENCYGKDEKLALYTLKDWDHEHLGTIYPSLYRLYMLAPDLKEYAFAEEYLDGYSHWKLLCGQDWFKDYIDRWRDELTTRIQAEALNRIRSVSETKEHKSSYEANKFLLAGSWIDSGAGKGRPKKADVKAEAERIARHEKELQEDAERIFN